MDKFIQKVELEQRKTNQLIRYCEQDELNQMELEEDS
jgi:hypothetical protein